LQNFTKLGQSAAELWPKTIFKMAAIRRLELKKIHVWLSDCHRVLNALLYANFINNRLIFR